MKAKQKENPFAREIAGYDRVIEVLSIDPDDFAILRGENATAIFRTSDMLGFSAGHHIVSGGPVKPIRLKDGVLEKLLADGKIFLHVRMSAVLREKPTAATSGIGYYFLNRRKGEWIPEFNT